MHGLCRRGRGEEEEGRWWESSWHAACLEWMSEPRVIGSALEQVGLLRGIHMYFVEMSSRLARPVTFSSHLILHVWRWYCYAFLLAST
jgi:hypothetical protein